jgi:hypothetical protein
MNTQETTQEEPKDDAVKLDQSVETSNADEAETPAPNASEETGEASSGDTVEQPIPDEEVKQPEVVVTEVAPVVVEPEAVKSEASTPEKSVQLTDEEAYIEKIRAEGTVEQKRILAAVESFAEKLNPRRPATDAIINEAQQEFLGHLQWALNKDYDVFRQVWNVILVYFAIHHGKPTQANYSAISEYSTNRSLHSWSKGEEKCEAYKNLLTLIRMTRSSATRKHDVKAVSLEKIGPNVIGQKQLENLQKFYQS